MAEKVFNTISIIVPTWNEEGNIHTLIHRIHEAMFLNGMSYELIFIDDRSTDNTREIIESFTQTFPISLYLKKGNKGKATSLIEGFSYAKHEIICMIDADLQYPPHVIPEMIKQINLGSDIIVASRQNQKTKMLRKITSSVFVFFFAKLLHHFDCDVQSGLKVFRKEIIQRFSLNPSPWTFDLEFLLKARDAGYKIHNFPINFGKRLTGESKINLLSASMQIGLNAIKLKLKKPQIIPLHQTVINEKGNGFHYKSKQFIHHSDLSPKQTAFFRLSQLQIYILTILFISLLAAIKFNWHLTVLLVIAILTILYFSDLLFNLFLILRSFSNPAEIKSKDLDVSQWSSQEWPTYTVFCPLYKEWQVVPQFVSAMSRLEYPKDKLQVMLLLEEDDSETIEKVKAYRLPSYFTIVIVPDSLPKTKPKACNYGLTKATGDYTVIYDAEDIPDPLQLKKAVMAFHQAGASTVCIQAKLNFYNPNQNLLTRMFTAEYSLWFDLVLTGLQSAQAPIPLGGTSNHFRTKDLRSLKGWDSFNVTEDCDLGMRLVKQGYKTAIIDSITLEEANSSYRNWFGQRGRWIKGYMQTYLVHMRNINEFYKTKKIHAVTFQLIVGGKILSMLINPLMWTITLSYFLWRTHTATFIESFFPAPILYMGTFSLVVGNFLYMYYYMIGCAKHEHEELIMFMPFVPFYWLAMSAASWYALYKLITAPHHWSKTKHGLHLKNDETENQAEEQVIRLIPNLSLDPAM